MWRIMLILPLLSASAIRVPVESAENNEDSVSQSAEVSDDTPQKPDSKQASVESTIDSYLVPPNPHSSAELPPDALAPATFLMPPSPNQQSDYYTPTDPPNSDWLPMHKQQHRPIPIPIGALSQRTPAPYQIPILTKDELRPPKVNAESESDNVRIVFPLPSRQLEPPLEDSPSSFAANNPVEKDTVLERKNGAPIPTPSQEIQLPFETPNQKFNPQLLQSIPVNFQLPQAQPTLSLQLVPPQYVVSKYPTKVYPKKYNTQQGFRPVPIPIAPYGEGATFEIPKAKPLKPFTPVANTEAFYPPDDKRIYQYEKAEQQRKLKEEDNALKQQQEDLDAAVEETYGSQEPLEQDTSETTYKHPGRNSYPAPLRQEPPAAPAADAGPPPPGDRTEFRMHGMKGPHSYQFGYDTGKGKNRQFRYEERDNDGRVRGHYGYVDRSGKLRVVNYNADPEGGFHAEAPQEKE